MTDLIATVDLTTKESLGYKIIKEDHIRCGNCNKKLLNVIKVKDSPIKNYLIVVCPYCSDKSFKYLVEGKMYVGAADKLVISKSDTDCPVENTFVSVISMEKEKI